MLPDPRPRATKTNPPELAQNSQRTIVTGVMIWQSKMEIHMNTMPGMGAKPLRNRRKESSA
jgi:hypothetical protein